MRFVSYEIVISMLLAFDASENNEVLVSNILGD